MTVSQFKEIVGHPISVYEKKPLVDENGNIVSRYEEYPELIGYYVGLTDNPSKVVASISLLAQVSIFEALKANRKIDPNEFVVVEVSEKEKKAWTGEFNVPYRLQKKGMKSFTIQPNRFLKQKVRAFYHQDYTTFGAEGNPDCINHLKNQFNSEEDDILEKGVEVLTEILEEDLPEIRNIYSGINLTVCVVPRAKAESYYSENQKLFRKTVSCVVNESEGYSDGTAYIVRHTDTRTTHLNKSGYGGDGDMPYPNITKDTCDISDEVTGKDILLIDDLYTKTVNIDEDAIQALLDKGAKSVIFYSVGKTVSRHRE